MLRKILNKHNSNFNLKKTPKWVSSLTGELQTNLFWVILTIIHDLCAHHFCNFKWERFDSN